MTPVDGPERQLPYVQVPPVFVGISDALKAAAALEDAGLDDLALAFARPAERGPHFDEADVRTFMRATEAITARNVMEVGTTAGLALRLDFHYDRDRPESTVLQQVWRTAEGGVQGMALELRREVIDDGMRVMAPMFASRLVEALAKLDEWRPRPAVAMYEDPVHENAAAAAAEEGRLPFSWDCTAQRWSDAAVVLAAENEGEAISDTIMQQMATAAMVEIAGVRMHLAAWIDPDHWEDDWRDTHRMSVEQVEQHLATAVQR